MCSYLHRATNGRYYFRMAIPAKLRPAFGGKREIKQALNTADRDTAKLLIPDLTKAAQIALTAAEKAETDAAPPHVAPVSPKSPAALERERVRWDHEQAEAAWQDEQAAKDDAEAEELAEYEQAIAADHMGARLLAEQREQIELARLQGEAQARAILGKGRASESQNQAVEYQPASTETLPEHCLSKLYERWASSGVGNAKTVSRWRPKVKELVEHLGHDDVTKVKRADLNAWIETLVAKGLTKKTVVAGYIPAVRVAFNVAFEDGIISANPASALKVRAPKAVKLRERDLTDDEAATILKATMGPQPAGLAVDHARARRWVPWLLAYTGARVGEITQLRAMDIQQEDGIWFIHITPEAGSVKTAEARKVPLHSHLIEQGFAKFAKAGDTAPLFHREGAGSETHPAAKVRAGDLAKWVRSLGITAPQPNHGWRHRFKSQAFAVSMDNEAADIMQGHVPRVEAGKYGQRGLPRLRDELEKLSRYEIEAVD